ncbi:exodeoxyribonuclease V subunit alpha [Agaribacter flavus]|uniref:RecBCD enzyme subunit RecD n=1 Tax=Agaribacter flavus TaxID=1902781 RepID=A0ABV7FJJ4_9ALTE
MDPVNYSINSLFCAFGNPYASTQVCLDRLHGIEYSDVYTANLLVNKLKQYANDAQSEHECENDDLTSESEFASSQTDDKALALWCEVFHVLLALLYRQRMGDSCLYIDALADTTLWINSSSPAEGNGYHFATTPELFRIFKVLTPALTRIEALHFEWPLLYTQRFFHYERVLSESISSRLKDEQNAVNKQSIKQLKTLWPLCFGERDSQLSFQALAVLNALSHNFAIITGAAGTGKTYSVARLLFLASSCLSIPSDEILLLAPTGKAANRLQESIQTELQSIQAIAQAPLFYQHLNTIQAQTLHRLLKINPMDGQTKFSQDNPLRASFVIIDEASMLDVAILYKLFSALPKQCKIVLIGDPNQLPSVEAGSILFDLVEFAGSSLAPAKTKTLANLVDMQADQVIEGCDNTRFNNADLESASMCVSLRHSKRSDKDITELAEWILGGDYKTLREQAKKQQMQAAPAWQYINVHQYLYPSPHQSLQGNNSEKPDYKLYEKFILQYVTNTLVPHFTAISQQENIEDAWDLLRRFACLTAKRVGVCGTENINFLTATALSRVVPKQHKFLQGQAIMIVKNDYGLQLFNGDIGIVWPDDSLQLWAWFPVFDQMNKQTAFRQYSLYTLPQHTDAYAMTIHKTQGSEYEAVDVLLADKVENLVSRQLIYTAVTRAKSRLRLFSQDEVLKQALLNKINRSSGIARMLASKLGQVHT